jgi:hypothetical protein
MVILQSSLVQPILMLLVGDLAPCARRLRPAPREVPPLGNPRRGLGTGMARKARANSRANFAGSPMAHRPRFRPCNAPAAVTWPGLFGAQLQEPNGGSRFIGPGTPLAPAAPISRRRSCPQCQRALSLSGGHGGATLANNGPSGVSSGPVGPGRAQPRFRSAC